MSKIDGSGREKEGPGQHTRGVLNRRIITEGSEFAGGSWESPRPCPVKLTEDTGRGQSRWFRVGACLCCVPPIGVALSRAFWGTRPERESNRARMREACGWRQTNSFMNY